MATDDVLTDEDRDLFRQTVKTAKPLSKSKKITAEKTRPPLPEKRKIREPENQTYLSDHYLYDVEAEAVLSYTSHSIPAKRLQDLRKGRIPVESRLDLHGMRPDEAKSALVQFINLQKQQARRCLLIIHGKGSHSRQAPILKNLVNHWLRQLPEVLAFHSCLPKDGGNGALYVLLKRQHG